MSIGCVLSYKVGACNMINAVPKIHANANSHRNKRSNTKATYFQSSCKSILVEEEKRKKKPNEMKIKMKHTSSRHLHQTTYLHLENRERERKKKTVEN